MKANIYKEGLEIQVEGTQEEIIAVLEYLEGSSVTYTKPVTFPEYIPGTTGNPLPQPYVGNKISL